VVHWPEAQEILKEKGFDVGDGMGDLNGAMVSVVEKLFLFFLVWFLTYMQY
jgi:hypothetical protein